MVQTRESYYHGNIINAWPRIMYRLLYLPGAMVLIYGFWLSLTA